MINISKKLIEKSKKNIVFIFFTYTNTNIAYFLISQKPHIPILHKHARYFKKVHIQES